MGQYLILKLEGPLQSWGKHSFEGLRPCEAFPGRSALLGVLAACLGIDRRDRERQQALADSISLSVRCDEHGYSPQKMTDYHTVKEARKDYQGLKTNETIQTWREYWQDAKYTVAIGCSDKAAFSIEQLRAAVNKPVYTPVLGRRSCPLARPLFEALIEADNAMTALQNIQPVAGMVYTEEALEGRKPLPFRDVPIINQPRQFGTRPVFMQQLLDGGERVSG